jgi:C1A family cysteine protease
MNTTKLVLIASSIILAAVAFNTVQNSSADLIYQKDVVQIFEAWRIKHNKTYITPEERAFRLANWFKKYLKVKAHTNTSYTIGLNKFSDMTIEEVKIKHFGYKKMSDFQGNDIKYLDESNQIPASVDWRTKGVVTPVKDQGQCGSCWAFSTTGTLEGAQALQTGTLISFSEQYLVDCAKNGNYGCDGGEMTNALTYVQKNGIPTEASYPYKAKDQKCKTSVPTVWKNSAWTQVPSGDATQLMQAIVGVPVALAIEADEIMDYTGGIFNDPACGSNLDHGVLLVGFTNTQSQSGDYWLVKNSWGTSWGDKGYIKFKKDITKKINVCGILKEAEWSAFTK